VRQATEFDQSKYRNSINFKRVRENAAEFKTIAVTAKMLRKQVNAMVKRVKDPQQSIRLSALLRSILKSDNSQPRGMRTIIDGDLTLMKGFEFSAPGVLSNSYLGKYETNIDRASGTLSMTIPEFVAEKLVQKAEGATHFQFHAAAVEYDFTSEKAVVNLVSSEKYTIENIVIPQIDLRPQVTAGSNKPLLLLFGIDYHIKEHDSFYELMTKTSNAVVVADVSVK
jgi:hypothetical protein